MAKNFKVSVKNAQLREVLEQQKLKTGNKKEPSPKKTDAKKASQPMDESLENPSVKKKVVRARKAPSGFAPREEEKKEETPPLEEMPAAKEKEEVLPQEKIQKPIEEEAPLPKKERAPPEAVTHPFKEHHREEKKEILPPAKPSYPERTHRPPSYPPRTERPSYPAKSFDRAPYRERSERPHRPFSERPERSHRPFSERPERPQRPYQERSERSSERPYSEQRGERPPYRGDRPYTERRPYSERPPGQGGFNRGGSFSGGPRPPRSDYPPRPHGGPGQRPPYPSRRPDSGFPRSAPPHVPTPDEIAQEAKRLEKKKGDKKSKGFTEETSEESKFKKGSSITKRQSFSRVFDSRDRSGLRIGDDETWKRKKQRSSRDAKSQEPVQRPKEITVKLPIYVKDLAMMMKLKATDVIQKLFLQGLPITINDLLEDSTTVSLIGHEFGCEVKIDTSQEERLQITDKTIEQEIQDTPAENLEIRPPVVTIMGHVDHGKTSIIDAFRKSQLTLGEAGAITQHIGAFQCKTKHGSFTVLDTPGHEAFAAIRERGAHVTDIVVLVVAGDEGIMPQTDEAIQKAQSAQVPIIVAINKMDKPGYNPDTIYRQLADRNLLPESWGGEIITVNCSAKTGQGIDLLGEMIALQSDVLELKANPEARARGTVLESELHRGLGSTATLLIQNGTLHIGDPIIFEHEYGKIKTMHDEHGKLLQSAPPSTPVRVTGLSGVPFAGNEFIIVGSEKEARKIAEDRKSTLLRTQLRQSKGKDIESLMKQKANQVEKKILNIILKADVGGSLEALKSSIEKIPTEKVKVNFVSLDVGQISESDIELAEAANAIIVGFHTNIESHAESLIKKKKVTILLNDIIYHLIDDIKKHMLTLLDKIREEHEIGFLKVLATFKSSQVGIIAGCRVEDGLVKRSSYAKLYRESELIWQGNIQSLKRLTEDVREVKKGIECGVVLEGFSDVKVDDIIKAFDITYVAQEL